MPRTNGCRGQLKDTDQHVIHAHEDTEDGLEPFGKGDVIFHKVNPNDDHTYWVGIRHALAGAPPKTAWVALTKDQLIDMAAAAMLASQMM